MYLRCCSPPDGFFFFSSRRRHTRCLSDWSSDVRSSDLVVWWPIGHHTTKPAIIRAIQAGLPMSSKRAAIVMAEAPDVNVFHIHIEPGPQPVKTASRSEERRVGKECSAQPWDTHLRKQSR